jgi:hypothetical protein
VTYYNLTCRKHLMLIWDSSVYPYYVKMSVGDCMPSQILFRYFPRQSLLAALALLSNSSLSLLKDLTAKHNNGISAVLRHNQTTDRQQSRTSKRHSYMKKA